jgi:hypothetical protein
MAALTAHLDVETHHGLPYLPLVGRSARIARRVGGCVTVRIANEMARRLRRSMTRQEVKLWLHLREES